MENFNTQHQDAIADYILQLKRQGSFTHEDLLEIESHVTEGIEDLIQKGLTWEESFLVTQKRLGNINEVALEYEKVNGPFAGRTDFLYLVLGMGLFGILYGFWNLAQSVTWILFSNRSLPIAIGFLFIIVFSISILLLFHKFFSNRKYLQKLEEKYTTNPINVGVLLLGVLIILNITLYFLGFWFHNIGFQLLKFSREEEFNYVYASILDISIWLLPVGVVFSCLYLLYSKGEKKSLGFLFKKAGFVSYLMIGFGWESTCSLVRHFMSAEPIQITSIVYGLVFNIGFFFLMLLLNGKKNKVLLAFILPALLFEGMGGFMNPALCFIYPISQFFVWLVVGILLVYGVGYFRWRNKTE